MGRYESPPIDRGWAWMIVIATAFGGFCMIGTAKSFGVVADELKDYFEAPQYMVSMVFGMSAILYTFAAPLSLILGERYSQRAVVMIGGAIGCFGMAISSLCFSLPYIMATFGVCFGVGNGFLYGNCLVMVGKYFSNRRSLANGIALAGSSVGQFALPPLIQFLINTYTIKGTLLLLGGIYFHVTGFGALLRPIAWYKGTRKSNCETVGAHDKDDDIPLHEDGEKLDVHRIEIEIQPKTDESVDKDCDNVTIDQSKGLLDQSNNDHSKRLVDQANGDCNLTEADDKQTSKTKKCTVPSFLDFSILKNRKCLLYSFAMFFIFFGYFNFILFLPTIALDRGVPPFKKAYLVSICGIADLIGRLLCGFISDFNIVQRYKILAWCSAFVGVDMLAFVWSQVYWEMALQSAIYGFLGGFYITLVSLVLIDFVGLKLLPRALAVVLFLQGFGAAVGQVFLGWIRDMTGNFSAVLIICGVCTFIGGVSLFAYPLVKKWEEERVSLEENRKAEKQKTIEA